MSNPEQPDSPRPERYIALIGPERISEQRASPAIKLLGSMLWAFEETQRTRWTVSRPESADVIVVSHLVNPERFATWKQSGKLMVVVALDVESELHPDLASAHVLVYPFRATDVLSLLNRLERQLSPPGESPGSSGPAADHGRSTDGSVSPWAFVETLRTLQDLQNTEAWLVGRDGNTALLWLKGDGSCYTAEPSIVHAIRRGALDLSWLHLRQGSAPAGGPDLRAGIELAWFAGYHASAELAPWLEQGQRFRLARRPDYDLILPFASQLRVCDILAETTSDVEELAACASVSFEEAARTVNALAACDLLAAPDARRSWSALPIVRALTSRLTALLRPRPQTFSKAPAPRSHDASAM